MTTCEWEMKNIIKNALKNIETWDILYMNIYRDKKKLLRIEMMKNGKKFVWIAKRNCVKLSHESEMKWKNYVKK